MMVRWRQELVAFAGLVALLCSSPTTARTVPRDTGIQQRIETELRRGGLRGARVGMLVVDAASGETVYELQADELLVPASVNKVLTAAAALKLLKPQYQFATAILGKGTQVGRTFRGDVYLRASGDPELVEERVWTLVKELKDRRGIDLIEGTLRVDDSFFDGERFGADWGPRSRAWYYAPHGAVSVNFNTLPVRGRYIAIEGDPSDYAARFFLDAMAQQGIRVSGGAGAPAVVPEGARALAESESKPLSEIVADLNKVSNNFIAEQLLKSMGALTQGAPGTVGKGIVAVASVMESFGIPPTAYVLADGSGLSRSNRLSPRTVVRVLMAMAEDFEIGPEFIASLKVAGAEGSNHRFQDPLCNRRLRVKSGHLTGVAALAGYGYGGGGRRYVFSIIANDYRRGRGAADVAIERLCEAFLAGEGQVSVAAKPRATLPPVGTPLLPGAVVPPEDDFVDENAGD